MTSATGKTIRVFLVQGSAKGLRTAEIGNWVGKAIVCPRLDLAELAKRRDVAHTGVYLLVGQDPDAPDSKRVYVGESEDVRRRLVEEHDKDADKEWWEDTIVLVSKDENLTKAHGLFLESELIARVRVVGKANSVNKQKTEKKLPESEAADMAYFLDQIEILLPALGFDFLEEEPAVAQDFEGTEFVLAVPRAEGKVARAVEMAGAFVVKAGSRARKDEVESLTATYRQARVNLLAKGKLVQEPDGHLRFTTDVSFKTPSAAACVVTGAQTNGREKWLTGDGTSFGTWHAKQVTLDSEAAEAPASTENGDSEGDIKLVV